jgi:hypothetical protein
MCLGDDALLTVFLGEASAADARHAASCPLCAWRLQGLRADLARIERHLASPPPALRAHTRRASAWAPLAAVAAVGVALLLLVVRPSVEPPVGAGDDTDVVAFVGEVTEALIADAAAAEEYEYGGAYGSATSVDLALGGRSTCGLDEPFIGLGCDNGVQLAALGR